MSWLAPAALAWFALVAALLVMYLLRPRRERVVVPSLLLWRRSERESTGSAFWRWLRRHLLLILQLLALSGLVMALARPARSQETRAAADVIVVMDASSSMLEPLGDAVRFDAAKTAARDYLASIDGPASYSVILASATPRTVTTRETSRRAAERAISALSPDPAGAADMGIALALAQAILEGGPGGTIAIVSDGAFNIQDPSLLRSAGMVGVGRAAGKVAIESFVRRTGPDGRAQATVALLSSRPVVMGVEVELRQGGERVAAKRAEVPAGGRAVIGFEDVPAAGELEALVGDGEVARDRALLNDDSFEGLRAAVVSDEPSAYVHALDILPGVLVQDIDPAAFDPSARFDVFIFDRFVPEALPEASLIFVDPPTENPWISGATAPTSSIPLVTPESEILQFVDLRFLDPGEASALPAPAWARADLVIDGGAALYHGLFDGRRTVVVGFDPVESGMARTASFPVFIYDAVKWANPLRALSREAAFAPGSRIPLMPHPRATRVDVFDEAGNPIESKPVGTGLTLAPLPEGRYRLAQDGPEGLISEEWFSVEPSRQASAGLTLGQPPLPPVVASGARFEAAELWPWLAAIALAVMAAEWVWYHRSRAAR